MYRLVCDGPFRNSVDLFSHYASPFIFQSTPDLIVIEDDDKEEIEKSTINSLHKDIKKSVKLQVIIYSNKILLYDLALS